MHNRVEIVERLLALGHDVARRDYVPLAIAGVLSGEKE